MVRIDSFVSARNLFAEKRSTYENVPAKVDSVIIKRKMEGTKIRKLANAAARLCWVSARELCVGQW